MACGGAFAVLVFFKGLVPPDADTLWHVAQGRLLLRRWAEGDLGLDLQDTFSWTAKGVPWHSNAWGFDALVAGFHDAGQWLGVAALRVVLLAALIVGAWAASRHGGAGRWARAAAVWVTVLFIVPSSAMRPQLVSFVLVLACLALAGRALDAGRSGGVDGPTWPRSPIASLAVLAVTIAVWAALHGAVVAGVVAIVAACVGDARDRRAWRRPAVTAAVAVAASCLSPHGARVWAYAMSTSGDSVQEGIQEWQPPSLSRGQDVVITAFLVIVAAVAISTRWSGRRPFPWRLLAPALLLTVLAFQAVRNEPLALLALLPFTASALEAAGAWLGRRGWAPPVHPGRALAAMTLGALLGGSIQAGALPFDPDPLQSSEFPHTAAAALPGGCRLLNEYDDGGYLIYARPDVPVSQDGRNDLYGPARLEVQERLLHDRSPERAAGSLRRLGVTCVLLRSDRELAHALAQIPGWRRVAADEIAEAWVRSS